jgi:hypothetical protein
MNATSAASADAHGPWNPGIVSPMPREVWHLATIFRADNVATPLRDAIELADLTGLAPTEIVAWRPQRLALHELLVRVTADFSVPDGPRIEDLGINFRELVTALWRRTVEPRMPEIVAAYDAERAAIAHAVSAALAVRAAGDSRAEVSGTPDAPRGWRAWFHRRPLTTATSVDAAERDAAQIVEWEARAQGAPSAREHAVYRALARVGASLLVRHGCIWGDDAVLARLCTDLACNGAGAEVIGALIGPWLEAAARAEGYALLQAQTRPVIMNTKGPSAAGKSTLRPLQRALAGHLGVGWSAFALISPDIWRKQLIDYGSLGAHYKYGGALTGDELAVIDQKLDRYIAAKAARDDVPHLLIDRFRFDSFAPDSDEPGSNLLTRFGQVVYLFFLVTPPASLVERAWYRGLEVGRYKSVDDVLAHAIEAYAGMPQLFFTWATRGDKRVHVEFLDNSVPQGERPRTIAFGWNDTLDVLDVAGLLAVERFRRVDVDARGPDELYREPADLAPERNAGFLRECVARLAALNFADAATGRVYLRIERGVPVWADATALAAALADADTRAALDATVPGALDPALPSPPQPTYLAATERTHTVGRWGSGTA